MPAGLRHSRPPLPRYAVAWFPRFEGIERIEAFRLRHDPAADSIAAHLSLVFPFPTAHSALQVETHVRRIASTWPPIPVTFRRELPYEPHITLARYPELDRLERALAEAEEQIGGEFTGVIRGLTLLRVEGNGRISALKTIDLDTA
jgi:2'-5' RNA ligase